MKPTWAGWPEVIAAQNADVESKSECLFKIRWTGVDDVNWVPEMTGTNVSWDTCEPGITADAIFNAYAKVQSTHGDLWTPVDQERTTWYPVNYPN